MTVIDLDDAKRHRKKKRDYVAIPIPNYFVRLCCDILTALLLKAKTDCMYLIFYY